MHAAHAAPSSEHSKLALALADENAKVAEVEDVFAGGAAVIAVPGAVTSTVHVRVAGDASTLPAASVARTPNM